MNPNNRNDDIIGYPTPFSPFLRRRPRRFTDLSYRDRSSEVAAMNAHLRASVYSETQRNTAPINHVNGRGEAAVLRTSSFLNLIREYDAQASDNFAKEAIAFAIITAIGLVAPLTYLFMNLAH